MRCFGFSILFEISCEALEDYKGTHSRRITILNPPGYFNNIVRSFTGPAKAWPF
jgi:hypothetical protein